MRRNPIPDPEIFELSSSSNPLGSDDPFNLPLELPPQSRGEQRQTVDVSTAAHPLPAKGKRGAYHIWTIGCQMNVADSNAVAAELEGIGYTPTDALDDADVVVLNTCVVRQSAENKGTAKASNLKPWKTARADRTLALMGCMVGVKPSPQLRARFPHVDVFMPPSEPAPLISHLRKEEIAADSARIEQGQLARRYDLQDSPPPLSGGQSVQRLARNGQPAVTAHVPVVYGCSHACTFCIIPFRRGIERSRPVAEIVDEVRGLVAQGIREVTLLGQIVDRFGHDWSDQFNANGAGLPQQDLADLLHAVHDIDGLWRIRFLTSHPNYMSDKILQAVRDLPKVCEHIEVPAQAGNDEALEKMKRGYTQRDYRQLIHHIRATVPNVAIHTDIIVGFCGETADQFDETYQLLADLKLDKAHLARYSPRPGTVSDRKMADDVPEDEKIRRHKALELLQERVCSEINARLLDEKVELLIEGQHKGKWRGRTRQNKLVFVEYDRGLGLLQPSNGRDSSTLPAAHASADLRGRLVEAQITWTGPWSMQGRFIRKLSPDEA